MSKLRLFLITAVALVGVLCGHYVDAALSTATDTTVNVTRTGAQTITWPFAAAADGTDSVHVPAGVHGLLNAAYIITDYGTDVIDNTPVLMVKEIISYRGHDTLVDTDIAGGHITGTTSPKIVHLWPTYTIPVSSELQLELSGALTGAGAPATGAVILTITPNVAKGS